ncbi:hypothetical protein JZ785_14125 [Alicyclobacillus curvatus]|nr:hypothetical protein JZ785_14125 [Alicyclobacillus curvatus]
MAAFMSLDDVAVVLECGAGARLMGGRDHMQMANVGLSGLILFLIPIVTLIFWITMLVAIFQIRTGVRDTSEKLNAIYRLLSDNRKSD